MRKNSTKLLSILVGTAVLGFVYLFQKAAYGSTTPSHFVEYAGPLALAAFVGFLVARFPLLRQGKMDMAAKLNLVIRTLRNFNQLLVNEKDSIRLLQGICQNLVENRGYFNAWIMVMDRSGRVLTSTETGVGEGFLEVEERMHKGELPECAVQALHSEEMVVTENPPGNCLRCPLSPAYTNRAGLTIRLEHDGKVYGVLCVSVPPQIAKDKEEQQLFKEIAYDVAFALYKMELEKRHDLAKRALETSEARYRQLFNNMGSGVVVYDSSDDGENFIVVDLNRAAEEIDRLKKTDVVGKKVLEAFPGADDIGLVAAMRRVWQSSTSETIPPAHYRDARISGWREYYIYKLPSGELITVYNDVTGRKLAEDARETLITKLDASERLFRSLTKVAPVGIFRTDPNGACTYVNKRWSDMAGIAPEMALGEGWARALHPEDRERIFEEWHASVKNRLPFSAECRFQSPDGNISWLLGQAVAEMDKAGNVLGYVGTITDITARKQTEDALRKSEENFRDLVENSMVGIQLIQNGRIIYQNPEQKRLFGPLPRFFRVTGFDNVHPDDFGKVKKLYESITAGEISSLAVDFRFYPMGKMGSGPDMKWVYCRARMIEYQNQETMLVSMIDISRAKELEQLLQVQDKMSSLGRVAAGIAHEIRNPLSGVNIYLDTLEKIYERADRVDKVKEILRQLQAASNKIESVIKRVMDFSKPSQPQFVSGDINVAVGDAFKLSAVSLRKRGIAVEKKLAADLPSCRFDPHMIEQVVLNLLNNSSEAMKYDTAEKKIGISSSLEKGRVVLRVYDSGPGIPKEAHDKVFDPFYTTKSDGTGIGLSLCHRIITDHGGTMRVETSQWGGAEFVIELPAE